MSLHYHVRPSEILSVSDPIAAYVIDLSVIAESAAETDEKPRKSVLERIRERRRRWRR